MTITYPTGTVREVVLLADDDTVLRVSISNGTVRTFTRVEGIWLSEACEPVTIAFQDVIGV